MTHPRLSTLWRRLRRIRPLYDASYQPQIDALLARDFRAYALLVGVETPIPRNLLVCWLRSEVHPKSLFASLPGTMLCATAPESSWRENPKIERAAKYYRKLFGFPFAVRTVFVWDDDISNRRLKRKLEECARRQTLARAHPYHSHPVDQ